MGVARRCCFPDTKINTERAGQDFGETVLRKAGCLYQAGGKHRRRSLSHRDTAQLWGCAASALGEQQLKKDAEPRGGRHARIDRD